MTTTPIDITNVGPIARATISCPRDGGVVVLRGRNGIGKSLALDAVETLIREKGSAPIRDGEERGEVSGFGAILKLGAKTRHLGELECLALEGLSAADLVDPPVKDPIAADAARIKALVSVARVKATPELFHQLAGGKALFEQLCPNIEDEAGDDVLKMASIVKRSLEAAARKHEGIAEEQQKHAMALREAAGQIDTSAESDEQVLQRIYTAAVQEQQAYKTQKQQHDAQQVTLRTAREKIAEAEKDTRSVKDLTADLSAAETKLALANSATEAAKQALRLAEEHSSRTHQAVLTARSALRAAESRDALVSGYRETLAATEIEDVDEVTFRYAQEKVDGARKEIEQGAFIRQAKANLNRREKHLYEAKEHTNASTRLRSAAGSVDGVLSSIVQGLGTKLFIEKGRLVTKTDRGVELFSELSQGERWKMVIDLCVDVVGATGLIVVPQESYEGLDKFNREAIAEHAKLRGVVIITAEASEDTELTQEIL